MKISTTLTAIAALAALMLTTPNASAQCSSNRSCPTGGYRPTVPTYQPQNYYPPAPVHQPIATTPCNTDPLPDFEPSPTDVPNLQEQFASTGVAPNLVTIEVQVQHPLDFQWKTVKAFDEFQLAQDYKAQIEGRYWIVYTARGKTKILEAANASDARSKTGALRSTGASIKSVTEMQIQFAEESFQTLFDDVVAGIDEGRENSKVPNELQPLIGLWEAATMNANGEVNRILLNLNGDGTAEMTVPSAGCGQVSIEREFAVEEGVFKLTGETDLILGEVLEAGPEKVVLNRTGSKITFLRP